MTVSRSERRRRVVVGEGNCPDPGGCASCPDPEFCRTLRLDFQITTAEQEAEAERGGSRWA